MGVLVPLWIRIPFIVVRGVLLPDGPGATQVSRGPFMVPLLATLILLAPVLFLLLRLLLAWAWVLGVV